MELFRYITIRSKGKTLERINVTDIPYNIVKVTILRIRKAIEIKGFPLIVCLEELKAEKPLDDINPLDEISPLRAMIEFFRKMRPQWEKEIMKRDDLELLYILVDGEVISCSDVDKHTDWMKENNDLCNIGENRVGGVLISTKFLGLSLGDPHDPFFFETMGFLEDKGKGKNIERRYKTYDEAVKGHQEAVKEVNKKFTKHLCMN